MLESGPLAIGPSNIVQLVLVDTMSDRQIACILGNQFVATGFKAVNVQAPVPINSTLLSSLPSRPTNA